MITEQERIIRKSQGYDIGFEHEGKKYWINLDTWNKEKATKLYEQTGLKSYNEGTGDHNLVLYDPKYFEVIDYYTPAFLHYVNSAKVVKDIPQPINMSSALSMFSTADVTSVDLSNWDTSKIVTYAEMFFAAKSLTTVNLSDWNVFGVYSMSDMFSECSILSNLILANWKTSESTTRFRMFIGCRELVEKYGIKNYDELLQKIIEDSNKSLGHLQAF